MPTYLESLDYIRSRSDAAFRRAETRSLDVPEERDMDTQRDEELRAEYDALLDTIACELDGGVL